MEQKETLMERIIEKMIFGSRWLQAPIYLGLVIASIIYSIRFFVELYEIGSQIFTWHAEEIMLGILGLIDITMVINLIIIVIIGGYWTFVSKINFGGNEDKPEWLTHLNPNTLKIKLIISLVSISGVHLLRTFINIKNESFNFVILQMCIHLLFVLTTLLLAKSDKLMENKKHE